MSKKYLRTQGVADRYGVHYRSVPRMVADKRIPGPVYLPGGRIPLWDEDALDQNDRLATLTPRSKATEAV